MGTHIDLTAQDGFTLGAYRAEPSGKPRGALVVLQEIFGVNRHIRNVCDRFAAQGYVAIAPALFDRVETNFESGYSPDEVTHARTFLTRIDWDKMLLDTKAAIDAVTSVGKVAIVGYCMGGSIAFLAATKFDELSAAVGYYGGRIAANADKTPKAPTQLHFGDQDQSIPLSDVAIVRDKRPDCDIHVYHAGHGFGCDDRAAYDAESAKLALERTLAWFGKYVG